MADNESTVEDDRQELQDVFVNVTGETVITDRQEQDTHKKVADSPEADSASDEQQSGADAVASGLEDAIGDSEPD